MARKNKDKAKGAALTSKLTEPFLFVSKASNRKCAYMLESESAETPPQLPRVPLKKKEKKENLEANVCKRL